MNKHKQAVLSKTCRVCDTCLTIEHFRRSKSAKNGFDSVCIKCRSLIQKKGTKKYRREHPPGIVLDLINEHNELKVKKERLKQETERLDDVCYNEFIKNVFEKQNTSNTRKTRSLKRICPVCRKNKVESIHHIIPRKYNGNDDKTNKVWLCNSCHDIIEEQTEDWIELGRMYDSAVLRNLIVNNGFEPIT